MNNIAIIPARSGSKGVKDKNIRLLDGKPLIYYTIKAAIQSNLFDCIHVSTDSELYADIAKKYGADVPFLRESEFADDFSIIWDVLINVINNYKKNGRIFDTVFLLQPTSPLRTSSDIEQANKIFIERQADSVISVCETEYSPLICNTLNYEQKMTHFINMKTISRRQEFPTYYRLNGAIYIQKVELLLGKKELYGENSYAYIMSKENSIDIDNEMDFRLAEFYMNIK